MRALVFMALLLCAACSPRGQMTLMPEAADVGRQQTVFVATTRGLDPSTGRPAFARDPEERFGRYVVSIPPEREVGTIRWPARSGQPDPARHFLTSEAQQYDTPAAFRADLSQAMRLVRGRREVMVFVHGFNNNFSEGIYRVAQLAHDLDVKSTIAHYSWPSQGSALGYVYDRDSALFARDGLESMLQEIARAGAERIILVGHSMGAALTMETLRQMALNSDRLVLDRLAGVILMSPDIDVDVFKAQAGAFRRLPQPFLIFTSNRDRALALSALIGREQNRLGNLEDVSRLAGLEVTLLEVGAYSTGSGHLTPGTSPALISILSRISDLDVAMRQDERGRVGLLPGVVLTVQNATQIILSPVGRIGEGLAN
jgi:esterase/lipase superfamily enzyme